MSAGEDRLVAMIREYGQERYEEGVADAQRGALSSHWSDIAPVSGEEIERHRELLVSQARELLDCRARVTCRCGFRVLVASAFRCAICGVWLCPKCSLSHFDLRVDPESGRVVKR